MTTIERWVDVGFDDAQGDLPAWIVIALEKRTGIWRGGIRLWRRHLWSVWWLYRRDWGIQWPLKSWLPDRW